MVGGTTLGVAGPALAADSRSLGPPAPKPVAAAGATGSGAQDGPTTTGPEPTRTSEPAYTPDPADQVPTTAAPKATPPPATEPEPTRASEPAYTPDPADQAPRRLQEDQPATTTTTTGATTTTTGATTTTAGATGRSAATSTRTESTATTAAPATNAPARTAAPTTASGAARQGAAAPTTASTTGPERQGSAAGTPATTHAYVPNAASDSPESGLAAPEESTTTTTTTNPGGGSSSPGGSSNPGGGGEQGTGREAEQPHRVVAGDNLWKIARDHLSRERSGGSGEPTNREVAAYWMKVVEANRDRLHSGDPDLIYPGERITLPPVD
jgi:hypothetical protein